jgi:hypothetical protein
LRCYTKAKGGVDRFYIAILEAPQTSTTCSNAQRIKVPATLPLNQNFWITPDGGCAPNNNLGCINQPNHPTYFWLKAKTAGTVKLRLNCSNPAAQLGIAVWKLPNGSPTNNTHRCAVREFAGQLRYQHTPVLRQYLQRQCRPQPAKYRCRKHLFNRRFQL